jgi:GNAT superfamily N-acetyltransferase
MPMREMLEELVFYPVTADRWSDFETLFGPRGSAASCSCMWWRVKRKDFEANHHEGNRTAMKDIVASGKVPGLLAYDRGAPVGWVSVGPRDDFPVLGRSPVLKPVDDQPVWSVVCFVVHRDYKRQGMSGRLLQAAVDYASSQGATIVEGYPIDPKKSDVADIYSFTGFLSTFKAAGFVEVARRSERKPIMRLYLETNPFPR